MTMIWEQDIQKATKHIHWKKEKLQKLKTEVRGEQNQYMDSKFRKDHEKVEQKDTEKQERKISISSQ